MSFEQKILMEAHTDTVSGLIVPHAVAEDLRSSGDRKRFRIQIWVSVATLLLTPLLSGLVVYYQLREEHLFSGAVRKQQRAEDRVGFQESLLRDTSRLLNHVSILRTQLSIHAYFASLADAHAEANASQEDSYQRMATNYTDCMTEIARELAKEEAELASTLQLASFVFSPSVAQGIQSLLEVSPIAKVDDSLEALRKKGPSEIAADTDKIQKGSKEYVERGVHVIQAMAMELYGKSPATPQM